MTRAPSPDSSISALPSYPLLRTKLYIPQVRPNRVSRLRLVERLMHGATCPLTLISAPAGYGKTTLLSEWIPNFNVAWLSLDEKDNDPMRFWTYIFSALETIQPGLTEHSLALLHAPQPPTAMSHGDENERIELALTALINALAAHPMEFVLVLDDYHVIETPTIHTALTFLLDHLTPQAHLFIASRADPPLPLARLRARGRLVELRAADLCFTSDEAAVFLNEVMGLGLAPEDIAALEARTEGWIAGLQLAALAMHAPLATQGRDDISGFIAAFAGSNRYILDYLIEEVLRRQPASVQGFLLQTSILDHLCGSLCEAVIGAPPLPGEGSGQAMLEMLEQANLFTIPLDQDRRWYRYHRLFADFLQSRLRQTQPDRVPELHRRAADWCEHNGLIAEAVDHALAAQDHARAGRLIEQSAEATLMRGEVHTLLHWLDTLPDALVHSRPRLCVSHALAMMILGQLNAVELHLQEADKGLAPNDTSAEAEEVRGQIDGLRAMLAAYQGDVPRLVELAHQAREHLVTENTFLRGMATWLTGLAHYLDDNAEAARTAFIQGIEISRAAGDTFTAMLSVHLLGNLYMAQGHLRQAKEMLQQNLHFLHARPDSRSLPITSLAHFGMGEILREQNDLEAAERYLREGIEIGKTMISSEWLVDGYLILARVKLAHKDTEAALDLLNQAQQFLPEKLFLWHQLLIESLQAQIWIAQGNLVAAADWAARQDSQSTFRRESGQVSFQVHALEHPMRARLWIAQHQFDRALSLLASLRQEAETGSWTGVVIESLALEALALDGLGQRDQALVALSRALALAEPEGYVRIFVDEGAPMSALLTRMKAEGGTLRVKEYLDKLFFAFGKPVIQPSSLILHPLVEPLSQREMQVLRLIADGLTNQEIAEHLVVGKSTIKTHVNRIFSKLDATSRKQAVARARELNLL